MPQDPPEYRVVYREGGTVRGLGRLAGGAPTLGELFLIDEVTRRIAARRAVRPRRRRS
jgi:hypothetical protein